VQRGQRERKRYFIWSVSIHLEMLWFSGIGQKGASRLDDACPSWRDRSLEKTASDQGMAIL